MSLTPLILVLNGPNLNMLGQREPSVYGTQTLADIQKSLQDQAQKAGVRLEFFQSNHEGELIDQVHQAKTKGVGFVLINPAALTHTSVALRDAMAAVAIPFVEIHLSNVHRREAFRQHSYFSDLAEGVICGLGAGGYLAALDFAVNQLKKTGNHGG
jgi:3-dehydroquinate dehydratase II